MNINIFKIWEAVKVFPVQVELSKTMNFVKIIQYPEALSIILRLLEVL